MRGLLRILRGVVGTAIVTGLFSGRLGLGYGGEVLPPLVLGVELDDLGVHELVLYGLSGR